MTRATESEVLTASMGTEDTEIHSTSVSLTQLRSLGYQIVRGLLNPLDVEAASCLLQEGIGDVDAVLGRAGLSRTSPTFSSEMDQLDMESLPADVRSVLLGHYPLETRLSRSLWQIPTQAAVQGLMRGALTTENLYMHLPPAARYVLPGNSRAAVPAHQDTAYNRHMQNFVVMWVPLVRIDEHCGGVAVYEGSHLAGEQERDADQSDWLGATSTGGFERTVCAPMEPGDVLLLDPWIIHESVGNDSDRIRVSVDYRFFGGEAPPESEKHFLDLQTREVIAPVARNERA